MWAHVERFGIDDLVEADARAAAGAGDGRRRRFAVQVPELSSVAVHWHDYYELGVVLAGRAVHAVNGITTPIEPGHVFLLSPADFHGIEAGDAEPLVMVNAVLHPDLVEPTLESLGTAHAHLPWGVAGLPEAEPDVRRVRVELERRQPGWEQVVQASLVSAVVALARVCGSIDAGDARDQGAAAQVRRAVRHVEQHFREPLSLADVAAVAHLSPHWFSEQFRRTTGQSFQSYLKRRRLQFARALLDSTDLGVTEVAHAAGFNDPSYFGRAYRAQYGVPPSRRVERSPAGR